MSRHQLTLLACPHTQIPKGKVQYHQSAIRSDHQQHHSQSLHFSQFHCEIYLKQYYASSCRHSARTIELFTSLTFHSLLFRPWCYEVRIFLPIERYFPNRNGNRRLRTRLISSRHRKFPYKLDFLVQIRSIPFKPIRAS